MSANTAPIRDLTLLRRVITHARANGWTHDTTDLSGLPRDHRWRRDGAEVNWFNACLYVNDTKFRPTTVRQAVNLLVDLDALPVNFHSAYAEVAYYDLPRGGEHRG